MTTLPPPPDQPVVRLSTPPEIVRAVPSLLGFHPFASLVVLGLAGPRQRLRMTLRIDLPAPGVEVEAAEQVASRLRAEAVSACAVVLFTASTDARPGAAPAADADPRADDALDVDTAQPAGGVPDADRAPDADAGSPTGGMLPAEAERVSAAGGASRAAPRRKRAFLPGASIAYAVEDALGAAGLDVRELLRAEGGRWWSYACDRPCCPPEGLSVGSGPTTLLEVLRVASGRPVFADRAELVASVRRIPGEPTDALNAAIRAREDAVAREPWGPQAARDIADLHALLTHDAARALAVSERAASGTWPSGAEGSGSRAPEPVPPEPVPPEPVPPEPVPPESALSSSALSSSPLSGSPLPGSVGAAPDGSHDDATVARVAVALTHAAVRDASFAWTGGPLADAATALWAEVVRRVPSPYAAAPATLLAVCAYRRGDGALADAYLRRALDDDPDYRMADLVLTSLENGFRPTDVESALGLGGTSRAGRRGTRSAPGPDGGTDAR